MPNIHHELFGLLVLAITFASLKLKPIVMKKVFAIAALAFAVVACNNEASTAEDAAKKAADSTRAADSIAAEAAKMAQDTTHAMHADSTTVPADSTHK